MRWTKNLVKEMTEANPEMLYLPMPQEIKNIFPVPTPEICKEYFHINFTLEPTGKLAGIRNLSTTCKVSKKCRARIEKAFRLVDPAFVLDGASDDDVKKVRAKLEKYITENPENKNVSVCGFCFSDRQQSFMKTMVDPLTHNYHLLNNGIIHPDWLPYTNNLFFRIESFGDSDSVNHATNMLNIVRKNPSTFFGIWTKNPEYYHKALEGKAENKPSNCNFLLSSQYVNRAAKIPVKYHYFIDKVFTVYTPEYLEAKNLTANCGSRACMTCKNCYCKNNIQNIREIKK